MKAAGAIPSDFLPADDALVIGGRSAPDLAEQFGTPCFVYHRAVLAARVTRLRTAMPPELDIHYAVKANPYTPILTAIARQVDGFDIASAGELRKLIELGVDGATVSFAGPGKRDEEIEAAIAANVTINLESAGEADRAMAIASRVGRQPRLAVRVNPDFDLKGSGLRMGGGGRPFGVDAAHAGALARRLCAAGAEWRGFHIYAGTQSLDADAIAQAQAATLALAGRLSEEVGVAPPLVNLGGGFGVPYFAGDKPLNVEAIGCSLAEILAARPAALRETRFAIELGRWLVAEAGVYLTRIVDRKESGGRVFLVVDGGMHHLLAASGNFGTVVRRNYPVAIANRFSGRADEEVTIVGCLCTPLDLLADQVALPVARPGDLVAVFMVGAYGATASPQAFLSHGPAAEALV